MFTTINRALTGLAFVFIGWIAVMALVMRMSDAAPAAVVLFPSEHLMSVLPADTAILSMSRTALTVKNTPTTTRALYTAGAWLVLPAGLTGCLPLTQSLKAKLS